MQTEDSDTYGDGVQAYPCNFEADEPLPDVLRETSSNTDPLARFEARRGAHVSGRNTPMQQTNTDLLLNNNSGNMQSARGGGGKHQHGKDIRPVAYK